MAGPPGVTGTTNDIPQHIQRKIEESMAETRIANTSHKMQVPVVSTGPTTTPSSMRNSSALSSSAGGNYGSGGNKSSASDFSSGGGTTTNVTPATLKAAQATTPGNANAAAAAEQLTNQQGPNAGVGAMGFPGSSAYNAGNGQDISAGAPSTPTPSTPRSGVPGSTSATAQGGTLGARSSSANVPSQNEWLATLISKMWPYMSAASSKMAREMLPPLLAESKPRWMGDITLRKLDLGGIPPRITDIRPVLEEGAKSLKGDDYVYLEADFEWEGDQDIELHVSPIPDKMKYVPNMVSKALNKATGFVVGVEDFHMDGMLRIAFRPMLYEMPIIGATQVSLIETPNFNFELTLGSASPLDLIPALKEWLYAFMSDSIISAYLLPEHYTYKMHEQTPDLMIPTGYVEVEVLEARNIPSMDWFGGSNTYCEVKVRHRNTKKTKVVDGKNPRWHETFRMPVHVPKHQSFSAILYDEDTIGSADEIGRAVLALDQMTPGQTVDEWLPVKPLHKHEKGDDANGAQDHKNRKKRDKFKSMLTKPIAPPNPMDKDCSLHIRLTYTALTDSQVQMALDNQQFGKPVPDPELRALLAEDPAPAGDTFTGASPTPLVPGQVKPDAQGHPVPVGQNPLTQPTTTS